MDNRRNMILVVLGIIVLVLLCGGGSWALVRYDLADDTRDFLIILLAIESMLVGAFLLAMLWQLYQLIRLLRDEVIPLLDTTKETVEQVKHTTTFVGQSVAAPIIALTGVVAGSRAMLETLRGRRDPADILRRERD